jgi:hypothetical protein
MDYMRCKLRLEQTAATVIPVRTFGSLLPKTNGMLAVATGDISQSFYPFLGYVNLKYSKDVRKKLLFGKDFTLRPRTLFDMNARHVVKVNRGRLGGGYFAVVDTNFNRFRKWVAIF